MDGLLLVSFKLLIRFGSPYLAAKSFSLPSVVLLEASDTW